MLGTIVISVDDGGSDTFRLAGELKKRNLSATFNIITSWVDGSVAIKSPRVTVEELKTIASDPLFEIAGHSNTHNNDDADVRLGNDKLIEWCGMKEIGFASPGSGMSVDYIRENGEKYKSMGISYIRTGSYSIADSRYEALEEKAKSAGYSEYVLSNLPFSAIEYDSLAVPSVVVVHQTPLDCIKELAEFTANAGVCTVFMFHAVRKEGEANWESTWSYDFDAFCEFADFISALRDEGKVEILTNLSAHKKHRK